MIRNVSNLLKPAVGMSKNQARCYTPRRALMFVPGDDHKKLRKAFSMDVDMITMDCEDGVAINRKIDARNLIRQVLDEGIVHEGERLERRTLDLCVRPNAIDTEWFQGDLASAISARQRPDSILLPKVQTPEDLKFFSDELDKVIGEGRVNLLVSIESAIAIINLVEICKAAVELAGKFKPVALLFGRDDYCASIGATRTTEGTEVLYARQKTVMVAKAFNLQAIDMVFIKFGDLGGLKRQCQEGLMMGYTGKQVIHPRQVPVAQESFMPSSKQIEWAVGLLKAFERYQSSGKGAFTYEGMMIDMPTMKQARNIVDLIEAVKNY